MYHNSVFSIVSVASGFIPDHHSPPRSGSLLRCHRSPLECCHCPYTLVSLCDGTVEEGHCHLLSHSQVALQGSHSFQSLESKDAHYWQLRLTLLLLCGLKRFLLWMFQHNSLSLCNITPNVCLWLHFKAYWIKSDAYWDRMWETESWVVKEANHPPDLWDDICCFWMGEKPEKLDLHFGKYFLQNPSLPWTTKNA